MKVFERMCTGCMQMQRHFTENTWTSLEYLKCALDPTDAEGHGLHLRSRGCSATRLFVLTSWWYVHTPAPTCTAAQSSRLLSPRVSHSNSIEGSVSNTWVMQRFASLRLPALKLLESVLWISLQIIHDSFPPEVTYQFLSQAQILVHLKYCNFWLKFIII